MVQCRMRLLLKLWLLTLAVPAFAQGAQPRPMDLAAPNGRHLIRLYPAIQGTIGNCPYDRADLMETQSGAALYHFQPLGGFVKDSVVWSPDSTHVAVYTHDHRTGMPLVVQVSKAGVTECSLPEITLPHERQPENAGRQWQSWLKPKKWLSKSVLLLSDSGVIQERKGVDASLVYDYTLQITFRTDGAGILKSTKRVQFERDKSWLKRNQQARGRG